MSYRRAGFKGRRRASAIPRGAASGGNHGERQPGQFVILQIDHEFGERIPLTIADADPEEGSITLIFQAVGKTTVRLSQHGTGDTIANLLGPFGIPITVSLNTIMVDGTGMCGGCRVTVGGETKFVCIDGPEFDGRKVDFDNMLKRIEAYREFEERAREDCRLTEVAR